MNHIDEGTIHAWLDGALAADEAGRVEEHVAQCATCAAAVAEARGLIAGASRILMALDDVPGEVAPKRVLPAATPARRRWRAAPWVTGIAAAMMLAVGIMTWNPGSARMAGDMTVMSSLESKSGGDSTPDSGPAVGNAGRAAAQANPQEPVSTRQTPPAAAPAPAGGSARERDDPRRDAGPALAKRGGTAASGRGAVVAAAPAPPPAASADTKHDEARVADLLAARRQGTVASSGLIDSAMSKPASQARAELLSRAVVTSAAVLSDADTAAATLAMAGCYRLGAPERREAANVAQRAAGAVSAATSAARSRAASPAPSAAEKSYAVPPAPMFVRLDTAKVRLGFAVRDQSTNAHLGQWERSGDSLTVELLAHGAFRLAAKDRVECPGR